MAATCLFHAAAVVALGLSAHGALSNESAESRAGSGSGGPQEVALPQAPRGHASPGMSQLVSGGASGLVPPVSEWPQGAADCQGTWSGRWMLKFARRMMYVVGFQGGYNADTIRAWTRAMRSLYCEDVEEFVAETGYWTPRDALIEYNQLQHPAFNSGVLKWEDFQVAAGTARCDDRNRVISFQVSGVARLKLNGKLTREAIESQGLFSLVFSEGYRCIRQHYILLPDIFRGTGEGSLPIPPASVLCEQALRLCGNNFPYKDLQECEDFMGGLPTGCNPDAFIGNTSACRSVHLVNAFQNPTVHCPHMSKDSVDPMTGIAKCAQSDCRSYTFAVSDRTDFVNCYTEASRLNICQTDPLGEACCSALEAYDKRGCFCDETVAEDLPTLLQFIRILSIPCRISLTRC